MIDSKNKDFVVCPHCGGNNCYPYDQYDRMNSSGEDFCRRCSQKYSYKTHTKYTFSTEPIDCMAKNKELNERFEKALGKEGYRKYLEEKRLEIERKYFP